jgi:SWIM zinc finger
LSNSASKARLTKPLELLAWFEEDTDWEGLATGILQSQQLMPIPSGHPSKLWATCATSSSNPDDHNHDRYWLMFNLDGMATCTCPDWLQCGGACKHLRAFRGHVLYHVQAGQLSWDGNFPASLQDAQDKQAKHGDRFNPPTKAIS